MKVRVIIVISLYTILLTLIFSVWLKDCKEYGKGNLAVPLTERIATLFIFVPIWLVLFLD